MDKMDEIFDLQEKLNSRIGVNMNELNDDDRVKWILNYIRAMQQELAELTDSVPWKWWAKYQEFDQQNARVEIVDLFHFLISLAQVMGMSADDVYDAYLKKNKVNHNRQDSGYEEKAETGITMSGSIEETRTLNAMGTRERKIQGLKIIIRGTLKEETQEKTK